MAVSADANSVTDVPTSRIVGPFGLAIWGSAAAACGGKPPYKFKKVGALPKGLKLTSSGTLFGVAVKAGTYTIGVAVKDHAKPKNALAKTFTLTVN